MSEHPAAVAIAARWRSFRALFAGVRIRLMLLALLVLAPAFGLLVYVADRERENGKDDVREKALYLARLAAAEQSQIVQVTHSKLQYLATAPETRGAANGACDALLAREIKSHPYFDNLGVLGPDGIRVCSVLQPDQKVDLADRAYFRRAIDTRNFSIGDFQIGRSSGKPSIGFGFPALDAQGAVRAVVYATLNLDWLGQSLARKQLPADAVLSVIDNRGTMLACFPENQELIGKPIAPAVFRDIQAHQGDGTLEGVGITGARLVWGYVPLLEGPAGSLIVRVSIPVGTAYAKVEQTYYRNLLFIALTALGVMLIAWIGSERVIMRPVRALNSTVQRLRRGEYGARTGDKYAAGELGELARGFDNLSAALQDREEAQRQYLALIEQSAAKDKLLRLFYDLPFVGLAVTSPTSKRWQQVNDRMCEMLGYPREELMELAWTEITHPDDLAANMALFQRMAAGEFDAFQFDKRFLRKDGGIVDTTMECRCMRNRDGGIGTVVIMVQDITERKRSEAALKRAFDDLQQQAITDPLTGLYNRRFLYEVLPRELTRAGRNKTAVAVMMMDIDHFKRVNDTYGHETGDLVLKEIARTIEATLRATDICCRYGGEEISVVLPEAPVDGARMRAEMLRASIEKLEVEGPGQERIRVTISIGVAVYPGHGANADALLRAADEALYEAKGAGRNRVVVARTSHTASIQDRPPAFH
jgi:diguanylate cyclase (GGDEF)-like protein/PAS domain S-box-containing protein